jgi:hypothetical protein
MGALMKILKSQHIKLFLFNSITLTLALTATASAKSIYIPATTCVLEPIIQAPVVTPVMIHSTLTMSEGARGVLDFSCPIPFERSETEPNTFNIKSYEVFYMDGDGTGSGAVMDIAVTSISKPRANDYGSAFDLRDNFYAEEKGLFVSNFYQIFDDWPYAVFRRIINFDTSHGASGILDFDNKINYLSVELSREDATMTRGVGFMSIELRDTPYIAPRPPRNTQHY